MYGAGASIQNLGSAGVWKNLPINLFSPHIGLIHRLR